MFRLVVIFISFALVGCSKTLVPKERTAIFPEEKVRDLLGLCLRPPEGVTGFWTPEKNDLKGIEDHLEEYLASVQAKRVEHSKEGSDWTGYYRQIGGIIQHGERMIFISYAWAPWMKNPQIEAERKKEAEKSGRRYAPDWWKSQSISVNDGGSMFFRVIYDLKRKQFVWYDQNGDA